TKYLRDLQAADALAPLLRAVVAERDALAQSHGRVVPLAVKIAPDLEDDAIRDTAQLLVRKRVDAVIATNTTVARDAVKDLPNGTEAGGLSGAPLRSRATAVVRLLARQLDGAIPIIAAGGVMSGAD